MNSLIEEEISDPANNRVWIRWRPKPDGRPGRWKPHQMNGNTRWPWAAGVFYFVSKVLFIKYAFIDHLIVDIQLASYSDILIVYFLSLYPCVTIINCKCTSEKSYHYCYWTHHDIFLLHVGEECMMDLQNVCVGDYHPPPLAKKKLEKSAPHLFLFWGGGQLLAFSNSPLGC